MELCLFQGVHLSISVFPVGTFIKGVCLFRSLEYSQALMPRITTRKLIHVRMPCIDFFLACTNFWPSWYLAIEILLLNEID